MEKYIYFINEEHSAGTDCRQHGAWMNAYRAKEKLKELVESNESGHFGEESEIDYDNGRAYSNNEEDDYTLFEIEKLRIENYEPLYEFINLAVRARYNDANISGSDTYSKELLTDDFLNYAVDEFFDDNHVMFDYDNIDNKLEEIYHHYYTTN